LAYAGAARQAGLIDLAESMEGKAYTEISMAVWPQDLGLAPTKATDPSQLLQELSTAQREALQRVKGYRDLHGLTTGIPDEGPGWVLFTALLKEVEWGPEDAARRAFAAKYRKPVPDLAPALDSVVWLAEPDAARDLAGKVVLVDVWGERCGPCVASLPHLQELWKTYRERGLVVVGLHCQKRDDDRVLSLLRENGCTYPVGQISLALCREFWVQGLPSYYLIDRAGRLVVGPEHEVPDESRIQALLDAPIEHK